MDALLEPGVVGRGAPKPGPQEVRAVKSSLIGAAGRCSGAAAIPRGGSSGCTEGGGGEGGPRRAAGGGVTHSRRRSPGAKGRWQRVGQGCSGWGGGGEEDGRRCADRDGAGRRRVLRLRFPALFGGLALEGAIALAGPHYEPPASGGF